jgi:rsbT antagonist protein RsbS
MNYGANIAVLKLRDVLMVTMSADPDDSTVAALQQNVLGAMERHPARGLILDISSVETLDSYFARTVSETAQMVTLMGGRTIVVGMQPIVAITATQMGLALHNIETALSIDRALDMFATQPFPRQGRR